MRRIKFDLSVTPCQELNRCSPPRHKSRNYNTLDTLILHLDGAVLLLTEKGEIHRRQPLVAGSTPVWCKLDAFHASNCTCNSVVRVRVLCCENLIFCFGILTSRCAPSPPSRIFPGGVPPRTPPEKILGAVPYLVLGPITTWICLQPLRTTYVS